MIYHIRPSCLLCLNTVLVVCNIYLLSLTVKLPSISIPHGEYETVIRHEVFEENVDKDIVYGHNKDKHEAAKTVNSLYSLRFDRNYQVPQIERTTLVNCRKILENNSEEISTAYDVMQQRPKVPTAKEDYLRWSLDCDAFVAKRAYVTSPLSEEEANYPLAFSLAIYTDIEQFERLLRAVYQPQNLYCIHIDIKSSVLYHRAVHSIANCFHNVFVAEHLDKIKWGDISIVLPEINCMRHLLKYYRNQWNYFIDLTAQEFPLRTNYELVQIMKIFNGSNDIAGSIPRMEMDRVKYKWTHRWSKTYKQTIFYNTYEPKDPPPYNLTFYKGELHGLFSRRFVQFIIESDVGRKYLQWCWDSGHPSEHYWNVLNYNRHLQAPGGYTGPQDLADAYAPQPVIRAKNWSGFYNNRQCEGKYVRGICVYGVGDLPWLASRPELFANKFHSTFEYLGYDCLEERHRNRTMLKSNVEFHPEHYTQLPTVKYGRKNGL